MAPGVEVCCARVLPPPGVSEKLGPATKTIERTTPAMTTGGRYLAGDKSCLNSMRGTDTFVDESRLLFVEPQKNWLQSLL